MLTKSYEKKLIKEMQVGCKIISIWYNPRLDIRRKGYKPNRLQLTSSLRRMSCNKNFD